ncbi:MAG: hypothetical protein M0Q90_17170 [Bacteroidales bacterium]|nr:hypothetical protein [Bacteroidales bacterium]
MKPCTTIVYSKTGKNLVFGSLQSAKSVVHDKSDCLFAVMLQSHIKDRVHSSTGQPYYLLADYLDSSITDVSGNILEVLSYDPCSLKLGFWESSEPNVLVELNPAEVRGQEGYRCNAYNWTDYNVGSTLFDRGYFGHVQQPFGLLFSAKQIRMPIPQRNDYGEHLSQFGLINMNGRVYDPFLARFLSPDPHVQAPDYSQNYNRYSYAWNNPLKYTDPSGEFIFTALAILTGQLWALPITIGADIEAITGGIRGANSDVGFWAGAGRGALVGGVGGAFAPMGGAGMTFGANLLLGTAQGAVTGGLDAILWGEDIGNGLKWGAFSGAIFATLTSSNLKNLTKGKGFYNNANVYENFRNGKYAIPSGSSWQQEALNHFGFEGTYDPNAPLFEKYGAHPGVTDPVSGEIFYHDFPFDANYDRFALIADHEMVHRTNVLSGKYRGIKMSPVIMALEEVDAYTHNYWNQGLYPKHGMDVFNRIKTNEWNALRDGFSKKWWHFINQIPRRW